MATENIGGIDVVIQAHDTAYTAAMRRAAMTARVTGQQINQAMRTANMGGAWDQAWRAADRYFTGAANRMRLMARDFRSLQFSMAGVLGGVAGYMGARAFVDQAGGFEQQMEIMKVVSGATAQAMGQARTQALALGAATARSANDIAGAQLELSKMGFSMQRVLELTPAVTNLSIASGMGMSEAAHAAGAIMRQFGLDAADMENVMDVIMRGANQSAADVGDFAGSLRYAGAMARAANMDLETTVAILEAASNAGMEGFMAGTSLRSLVGDFQTPMPMAAQMFRQFNIQLRDGNGQLRDMLDLMEDVLAKVPRNLIGPPMFEVDSANLLNALGNSGIDSLRAMRADLQVNQTGEAARTAEARMRGLKGAIETLSGAFETLLVKIGDSGFLAEATKLTRTIGDWIAGLSEAGVQATAMVGAIGLLVVATGPLLFALGAILTILTSLQGILLVGAGAIAATTIWGELSAAIEGTRRGIEATKEGFEASERAMRGFAGASRDAQLAMIQQNQAALQLLRTEADRLEIAARQAAMHDATNPASGQPGFARGAAWFTQALTGWAWDTPHDQANVARAAAEAARQRFETANDAAQAAFEQWWNSDPERVAARQQSFNQARVALETARRNGGANFDTDAWLRANPEARAALAQPAYNATRGALGAPVAPATRFMGFTPGAAIARETEQIRRLAEVAAQGAMAMEDLQEAMAIRDQSINPTIANPDGSPRYEISAERAQEIVRERRALRQQIEMGRLRHETNLTITEQQRLTEAANQGAIAYERMQIAAQLMRQIPGMGLQDALNMAEEIRRSNEQLDRAVTRMQRWAQTFQAIGDRIAGAFEEAITQGGSLGDVLKSLARDLLMLVLRAAVLEPLARSIGDGLKGLFGGGGAGSGFSLSSAAAVLGGGNGIVGRGFGDANNPGDGAGGFGGGGFGWRDVLATIGTIFGGGFAAGGQLGAGKWGIVGENGPEFIRGGRHGATIVPLTANSNRPGGMTVDARAYINAAGADPAAIARLEAALARRDAQLPRQIEAGVWNMNKRGRAWA